MAHYVYRVENNKGYGPYRAPQFHDGSHVYWYEQDHGCSDSHPLPEEEGLPTGGAWICGFKTKHDLHAWFSKIELRRLAKLGFKPRRVRARVVFEGLRQAMFIRERRVK